MCYSHMLPDNITRQQRGGFINEIFNFTFARLEQPVLLQFSLTVKVAPHECVIRTSQL